jgi:hypothetical protein
MAAVVVAVLLPNHNSASAQLPQAGPVATVMSGTLHTDRAAVLVPVVLPMTLIPFQHLPLALKAVYTAAAALRVA